MLNSISSHLVLNSHVLNVFGLVLLILSNYYPKSGRFPRLQIHLIGASAKAGLIRRDTRGTGSHRTDPRATPFSMGVHAPRTSAGIS